MKNFPMGIGALSKTAGASPETVRYYEREGLLPAPLRTEGGHRKYAPAHLQRLIFIVRARALGFSQAEVRQLLDLSDRPEAPCHEVQILASTHLADVKTKIQDLRRMERVLKEMVKSCDVNGQAGECPIVATLNEAR